MWRAPEFWQEKGPLSTLLLPVAALYRAVSLLNAVRTRPAVPPVPVVCVGNLVAGGAGKTPAVVFVAAQLASQGKKVFCLSKGYGGRKIGPLRVDPARHTAADVGDEPLLLAAHYPTVVAKSRRLGVKFAAREGADIIVMDDGFQNPSVAKSVSLLVVDGSFRFGNERLLPAGPLREPVAEGLRRADAVIVIGGSYEVPGKPVFSARLSPASALAESLRGQKVLAFAGIGRPEKFRETLKAMGCDVMALISFPDHHAYTTPQLETLYQQAKEDQVTLVTTEKDAARMTPFWRGKMTVVPVTLQVDGGDRLASLLKEKLAA